MENYQIFISYRRDGGEFLAGRVSDKLADSGYCVFYDVESMRAGPFNEQIYAAIDQCEDVLLVLPPHALDRCRDAGDWVRKEIEYALSRGKNVIPLLMRDFHFPDDLPESMAAVAMCEGVAVDSHYFDAMMERIRTLLRSKPQARGNAQDDTLKDGVRLLSRKMFPQALACFERVICEDISEPLAYFYAAVAKLEGKRPFLVGRSAIAEVETYLDSAVAYGERGLFYYLLAYVKYDHYEKKMLKASPSSRELLAQAQALGVSSSEIAELFELLNVQKPDGF